jgi:para-nitrobenzyl esterase
MVWLHGGGHTSGAGSLAFYDGRSFARDGVILVTINYRLGLLGYFAHPALTREAGPDGPLASYGTLDQLAALRWVQRNIAAFGGDPARVTVFGESAGAQSVLTLLATPAAKGLFARAIAQSAYIGGTFPTLAEAEATGAEAATKAGLAGAQATAAQLRAIPGETLIAVQEKLPIGPIVDGRLLPARPALAFAAGAALKVPLMIGTNSDEGSLIGQGGGGAVMAEAGPVLLERARAAYGASAADEKILTRKLWRDWTFTAPTRWTAEKLSPRQPVYVYHYDYTPERLRKVWDGVPHGYEVPFIFDSLGGIPQYAALLTPGDKAAIAVFHAFWVSFAKTGAPVSPGAPAWPAFDLRTGAVMDFGLENRVLSRPDGALLDAVEARLEAVAKLPS